MKGRLQDHIQRMEAEELFARGFLALGVLWWTIAAAGALFAGNMTVFYGLGTLAAFTLVALVVGWRFERTAAALLVAGAGALIGLGITLGWEVGIWGAVAASLIVEMLVGAGLLFAAREEETVIEHEAARLPAHGVHA